MYFVLFPVRTVEAEGEKEEGGEDVENGKPLELHCLLPELPGHEDWPAHLWDDEEGQDPGEVEEEMAERESEGVHLHLE